MLHALRLSLVAFAAGASLVWTEPRDAASTPDGQEAPPSLTGTWVLDKELTERPRDQTLGDPEGSGADAAFGMGSRGGRGARDVPPSGGGARGGRPMSPAERGFISQLLQPAESLLITQSDTSLLIDNGLGYLLKVPTSGRVVDEPRPDGTVNKSKATRRNNEFIVERDMNTSGSTREVYRLDPANRRLTVEFRYEHKRQRRTYTQKRVYQLRTG